MRDLEAGGISCPGRAKRDTDLGPARDRRVNARKSGKPDLRGTQGRHDETFQCPLILPCNSWVPGLRSPGSSPGSLARDTRAGARTTRAKSRRAQRTVAHTAFTMSNSAVFFVPAARCCARVRRLLRI